MAVMRFVNVPFRHSHYGFAVYGQVLSSLKQGFENILQHLRSYAEYGAETKH